MRRSDGGFVKMRGRAGSRCALAWTMLALSGCMVGPKYRRPSAAAPAAYKERPPANFKEAGEWKPAQPNDGAIRGKWWEIYNDPVLNALEEQVAISNQNVLAAEAQYQEAKTVVRIARTAYWPTGTTAPSVTSSRSPSSFTNNGQVSQNAGARGFYNLPFALNYQADLWGSIRRTVTAATEQAQATEAQLENAKLTFQAELAQDYFGLHGLDGEYQILETTVKSFEKYLVLTQNRYAGGIASQGDVALAETQLATTRAQMVDIGVQRAQFEHAVAILAGKPPSALTLAPGPIQIVPPPVPIGVPSELLERRPDIAGLERQMAAANEQIGIAQAAFYPALTLSAAFGFETADFGRWLTWPSRLWSVGPQLAETLFDAGRRHAVLDETRAAYDVTVANYRQTVLTAFQQVEDNLAALRVLEDEAKAQDDAVKAAERSLRITTDQYKGGIASYLQVITTQSTALQNEVTAATILTRRMTASVLLVEALGGGWDTSKLPTPKEVQAHGK